MHKFFSTKVFYASNELRRRIPLAENQNDWFDRNINDASRVSPLTTARLWVSYLPKVICDLRKHTRYHEKPSPRFSNLEFHLQFNTVKMFFVYVPFGRGFDYVEDLIVRSLKDVDPEDFRLRLYNEDWSSIFFRFDRRPYSMYDLRSACELN